MESLLGALQGINSFHLYLEYLLFLVQQGSAFLYLCVKIIKRLRYRLIILGVRRLVH